MSPRADRNGGSAGRREFEVTLDRSGRITSISRETAARWGREPSQLVGVDVRSLMLPSVVYAAIESAQATGQPTSAEFPSVLDPNVMLQLRVRPTDQGLEAQFWDVTDEQAARHGEALAGPSGSGPSPGGTIEAALLSEAGEILNMNTAMREALVRLAPAVAVPAIGSRFVESGCSRIPDLDETDLQRALDDLAAGRTQSYSHPYVVRMDEGSRWKRLRVSRLTVAEKRYLVAIHEDLTEVIRAHDALANLEWARGWERELIALELHDSTSQHLAALSLGVARLRQLHGEHGPTRQVLDDMSRTLREALREVRVITHLMRPLRLQRDGLEKTARRLVDGFGVRAGLNTAFRASGGLDDADEGVQRAALRVIQEALTNIHRHAEATSVTVELGRSRGSLTVRIIDDGRGMRAPTGGRPREGVGLSGMRSRVEALGGSLRIASNLAGTTVTARFPAAAGGRL
jgi:signal transduction histidine kinase